MKSLFTLLLIITFSLPSWSQDTTSDNQTTTYYFIRHAEKDRTDKSNRNPELNKLGKNKHRQEHQISTVSEMLVTIFTHSGR